MPNKLPPSPEFTQEEWNQCQAPLIKIDPILKEFSKKYGFHFRDSWSHDWPMRTLTYRIISQQGDYHLAKGLYVRMDDGGVKTRIYEIGVGVYTNYGFKEFYAIIPFLTKRYHALKQLSWGKSLAEFKETIDHERLKQLLEEAKQILDNFDESWLKEGENRENSVVST